MSLLTHTNNRTERPAAKGKATLWRLSEHPLRSKRRVTIAFFARNAKNCRRRRRRRRRLCCLLLSSAHCHCSPLVAGPCRCTRNRKCAYLPAPAPASVQVRFVRSDGSDRPCVPGATDAAPLLRSAEPNSSEINRVAAAASSKFSVNRGAPVDQHRCLGLVLLAMIGDGLVTSIVF